MQHLGESRPDSKPPPSRRGSSETATLPNVVITTLSAQNRAGFRDGHTREQFKLISDRNLISSSAYQNRVLDVIHFFELTQNIATTIATQVDH